MHTTFIFKQGQVERCYVPVKYLDRYVFPNEHYLCVRMPPNEVAVLV